MGFVISILITLVIWLARLAVVVAPIAALIYAYRKLPRSHFFLLLSLLMAGSFVAFRVYEQDFKLSVVPDALHVSTLSYSEEESWGFGPGGNEAGIRVYPLPEREANQMSERGIEFFKKLPRNQHQSDRKWRGMYEQWSETPIKPDRNWKPNSKTQRFDILDYICAYGFCIDIDPAVAEEANAIVNSPGSYYAYGRIGVIVVSPGRKRVLYLYNG